MNFTKQNNFAITFLLISIFLASMSVGINIATFPAILIQNNVSSFLVGFTGVIEIISSVILSFFISKIIARLSILKASFIFGLTHCASILSIFFYQNYYLWAFFSIINGACFFALFVIRQSWLNSISENDSRSLIIALTTTIFCIGCAIGSFAVKTLGATSYSTFIMSSFLIAASVFTMLFIKNTSPKNINSQRIKFKDFFDKNSTIFVARFLLDFQNYCLIALTILFGVKIGISPENASLLIASFMASGLFDLYAGFLVKKYNKYFLIKIGFLGCFFLAISMFFLYENYIILIIIFFLFGSSCALTFVATLTIANDSFASEDLVSANACLNAIGAIGSLFGVLIGSILIEFFNFYGFLFTLSLASITYLLFSIFYENKKNKAWR